MTSETARRSWRPAVLAALLLLVTPSVFAQSDAKNRSGDGQPYEWGDIVKEAIPLSMEDWGAVGYGDVAEGFVSFALDVFETGPITLEVIVTDIRMGAEYEDDDSMLWLFSREGVLVAENDDSELVPGYASLINGFEIESPGRYYVVVTTHPNSPEVGFAGEFVSLTDGGASNISFELLVEYGAREDVFGGTETALWFEDFDLYADPVRYTGGELVLQGNLENEPALYRISVDDFVDVSLEVYDAFGNYGDTQIFLIDELGFVVAEDDDSGIDGGSLIFEATLSPTADYYVAVTSFPNAPNVDEFGLVEGFPPTSGSSMEFELVVGPPREYVFDDDYGDGFAEAETEIWFDEFPDLATDLGFFGGEIAVSGVVADDVALYRVEVEAPMSISVEVVGTPPEFGDTVLFVIDQDGYVLAEDDDSAGNSGSLIHDVYLEPAGPYYIAVVSYPNWPNRDEFGYVEGFPRQGQEIIEFDLTLGPPQEYVFDDGPWGEPAPDGGIGAYSISEVADWATDLRLARGEGVASGSVGTGFASFAIEVDEPLYMTLEVVVTEVRQGTSYADSDSVLSLFGPDGEWYATDDDGGVDGASRIEGVWLPSAGTYYAVVTTYPNEPSTRFGAFEYVEPVGESNIGFDLVVTTEMAAQ